MRLTRMAHALSLVALAGLLTVVHSSLTSSKETVGDPAAQTGPLTATKAESTGGPAKVANEATVGTIKGTIKLEGTPPPRKTLNLGTCSTENKGAVLSDDVLVKDGKVQNAFVWIKKGLESYKGGAVPSEPIVMDQKGCIYSPHVVGAQVGQKIVILNSDPTLHNVRTVAEQNAPFNEMMQTKDMRLTKTFDKPEVMVRAKCDVHPWMSAFVGVVPHPFYAVSNEAGEITLQNVPEGEVEVEAWHELFGRRSEKITVKPRGTANVAITFKVE